MHKVGRAHDKQRRGYSHGAQRHWLERTLARLRHDDDIDWIIVCMHQVAMSSANFNDSVTALIGLDNVAGELPRGKTPARRPLSRVEQGVRIPYAARPRMAVAFDSRGSGREG